MNANINSNESDTAASPKPTHPFARVAQVFNTLPAWEKAEIDAMTIDYLHHASRSFLFRLNRLAKHPDKLEQANTTKSVIYAIKGQYLLALVQAGQYERVERFSRVGRNGNHDCECGRSWVGLFENNCCRYCQDNESVHSSPRADTWYVVDLGRGERYHYPRDCEEFHKVAVEVPPHDPEQPAREIPPLMDGLCFSVAGQIYALERYIQLLKRLVIPTPEHKAFLKSLTPDQRKKEYASSVAYSYTELDYRHSKNDELAGVLNQIRLNLPHWRLKPNEEKDRYTTPILERPFGRRPWSLRTQIANRRCLSQYGHRISELAAQCGGGSLDHIRRESRRILGIVKLPTAIPKLVRAEWQRQEGVRMFRRERSAGIHLRHLEPMFARWPNVVRERIAETIHPILRAHYRTSRSRPEDHELHISFGDPNAKGYTAVVAWQRCGLSLSNKWVTVLTFPLTWFSQIRQLGTCVVDEHLVLGVTGPINATSGEAVAATVLVQWRGSGVFAQEVALHREFGEAWTIHELPDWSDTDRAAGIPPTLHLRHGRTRGNSRTVH